jgi:hypothetical protein
VIADIDDALRTLVRREAVNGTDVELLFDAPTRDWAARRNVPALDFYLYDIREDLERRTYGVTNVKAADGRTEGRRQPPKIFKLSYLVTAWTQRPEDEHRLLSAVLFSLLRHPALPEDVLTGVVADMGYPVAVTVALPPPDERSISDVWSALGGELKPSLDVVCRVAVDPIGLRDVGPPVLEQPRFQFATDDTVEARQHRRGHGGELGTPAAVAEERIEGGTEPARGRIFTFRTTAGDRDR